MKPRYGLKPGKAIQETRVTLRDLRAAWYAKQGQCVVEPPREQRRVKQKQRYSQAGQSSWHSLQRD